MSRTSPRLVWWEGGPKTGDQKVHVENISLAGRQVLDACFAWQEMRNVGRNWLMEGPVGHAKKVRLLTLW